MNNAQGPTADEIDMGVLKSKGELNEKNTKEPSLSLLKAPKLMTLYFPWFTILVSIVNLALLVWMLVINRGFESPNVNPTFGPSAQTLLLAGAKYGPLLQKGEWWRWIAPIFLHAGIMHLFFNLLAQIPMGWGLEKRFGVHIFAPIYLFSGLAGNLLSAIFIPNAVSVGASGALFGIFGMALVDIFQNLYRIKRPCLTITFAIISMIISFGFGLLPYVDNFAHIGGFIWGVFISVAILPIKQTTTTKFTNTLKKVKIFVRIFASLITIGTIAGLFLIFYLKVDVNGWCKGCQYLNCIPNNLNGTDWCDSIH